jgi:hypothetical protein
MMLPKLYYGKAVDSEKAHLNFTSLELLTT